MDLDVAYCLACEWNVQQSCLVEPSICTYENVIINQLISLYVHFDSISNKLTYLFLSMSGRSAFGYFSMITCDDECI